MLWIKAAHIIAVVCWFAGIFYLPRLFVYHAMAKDEISLERFKVMERKLYRGIMWPSAIASIVTGGWLLGLTWASFGDALWMHLKLVLAAVLFGYHLYCGRLIQTFALDANRRSDKFYRVFNELPVILLIAIVIFVVVKPFG